jgi:hypothetical protein
MSFKKKPNRYVIDIAPSNRARCRCCRRQILKGSVRMVTIAFVRPSPTRRTQFVRFASDCMDAKFAAAVVRSHGEVGRVPDDSAVPIDIEERTLDILTLAKKNSIRVIYN